MSSAAPPASKTPASKAHRGTIFVEEAEVLAQQAYDGNQFILRLAAPKCAAAATPGAFVHLTCDASLPMRRPLSIMRADPRAGSIEVLYKIVGPGLKLLAQKRAGDRISTLGPIGNGFVPHPARPRTLLVGGGVGIPPMIFLAEALLEARNASDRQPSAFRLQPGAPWAPLVLMGSEIPFPFRARPSTILVPGIPDGTIASMPQLEEWGIPSRLASLAGFPGCYEGYVTDLGAAWLQSLDAATLAEVEMFACGPTPMLKAAAAVARRFRIPCQVSLEEFMACAVGGCAGCAVRVETPDGPAMKKVCVDGPVFDAQAVFTA
jgi:dihydroorotate dehydrogenase electron transfer subunit